MASGWIWGERKLRRTVIKAWRLCENLDVRTYAVVIREDPEGGFWGEVPALPGCYSQGETVDELKNNIREAIAGVLEVLKEQGREPDANIQILDVAFEIDHRSRNVPVS
jgi:predicted RNase H-like HicB family nuclease